jgi:predicted oxidoreductase
MAVVAADVVVVGAGIAGVVAALEASERGAQVTVIDAAEQIGGTARISGGGMCIAGSPAQAAQGVTDSPEQALEDWLAVGGPSADAAWAQRYLEASVPEVFDYLTAAGVHWLGVRPQEGNRVPRWHAVAGAGRAVMGLLTARARQRERISWRLGTRATELMLTGGAVTGLIACGPDGEVEYRARSVLLASGGFLSDAELTSGSSPSARAGKRILLAGGPGAFGDGHRLAHDVGAHLVNMGAIWMYPYATVDDQSDGETRGLVLRGIDDDVWINSDGQRFHDEALRGGASGAPAVLAQQGATCWSVIDARIASSLTVWDGSYRTDGDATRQQIDRLLTESRYISSAPDWTTLGARIGVNAAQVEETMREHNRARKLGRAVDPDFGRPLAGLKPIDEPPYYAIQFFAAARKNLGGVRTDENCQVLRTSGDPVPGLFAAGEVSGMAGGHINGQAALEGTMLGPSLYSGRVAGRVV